MDDEMIFLHGDLTSEHILEIRKIFSTEDVFRVISKNTPVTESLVQAIIRRCKIIDYSAEISLDVLLSGEYENLIKISHYFKRIGKKVNYIGLDLLIEHDKKQFSVLYLTPIELYISGIKMLKKDLPEIIGTISNGGCIKYLINSKDKSTVTNCQAFKDIYEILNSP